MPGLTATIGRAEGEEGPNIATPCAAYERMACRWDLPDALWGGTREMRRRRDDFLPQEDKEGDTAYEVRVGRSFLYNAFKDTVQKLAARPFAKPITVKGQVPDKLKPLYTNVDRKGLTLTDFSKELLTHAIRRGITHVLVDYPKMPTDATIQYEKDKGARPVFVHIPAPALIYWQVAHTDDGQCYLTEIRFKELHSSKEGEYGEKEEIKIRKFTKDTWELWHQITDETGRLKWVMETNGVHTFGAVPLVTFNIAQLTYMEAEPPMEELAWLNLNHWQSYSDYRNILRFASVGILFGAGLSEEQVEKGLTIGPNRFIGTTDAEASLQYVEHTGKAIGASRDHLKDLLAEMIILGLQPLIEKTGGVSATSRAIDESKSQSSLQSWIRKLEVTLMRCYQFAATWVKVKLGDDFEVDVYDDFGISMRMRDDILALIEARSLGEISSKTLLNEFKRRGLLADTTDVDKEVTAAKADGPPQGARNMSPGNPSGGGSRKDRSDKRDPSRRPGKRRDPNANHSVKVNG
jgi:hypothetical protein